MSALRSSLMWGFRRVVGIYFRDIEAVGQAPDARTGGRIFAANHVNGLVDPILVLTTASCAICPVAKSTLWKIPGLRWLLDAVDAVPIVRRKDDAAKAPSANDEVFARVAAHLGAGGNILIFPEGTSHNEPGLAPLKSGAGRMLAAARAAGARGLTFQAVGLEFDARDVFRSRALVVYGPVRDVDTLADASSHSRAITQTLAEDLGALLVLGTTWDARLLVARVAELFANESGDATLAGRNAIGREVEAAKRTLEATSPAELQGLTRDVSRYHDMLVAAGARDAHVARGATGTTRSTGVARLLLLPLAALGVVLYAAPYRIPRLAARAAADEVDVISTYKVATGLVVFPLWAVGLVAAAFVFLPPPLAVLATALALASPFAALAVLDRRDARTTKRSGAPTMSDLRAARADLVARLETARTALGTRSHTRSAEAPAGTPLV